MSRTRMGESFLRSISFVAHPVDCFYASPCQLSAVRLAIARSLWISSQLEGQASHIKPPTVPGIFLLLFLLLFLLFAMFRCPSHLVVEICVPRCCLLVGDVSLRLAPWPSVVLRTHDIFRDIRFHECY